MAHSTERTGAYSELVAMTALTANGYTVSKPFTKEKYDLIAEDPLGHTARYQVKTIHRRADRNNDLVVFATTGGGKRYSQSDFDYFIAVLGDENEPPRAFLFENTGQREYWATESRAAKRWVELSITLNRELLAGLNESAGMTTLNEGVTH
ncbi:group I intron-associated PD-(D/E)XK endonuclease [Psychrobacillus sp. MER TA 17]|nr:group I intron-associated PD-(D/E)XK endonuclease [Psychrobacillus sp. MER TA 17]